ncbi:MAG: hypothetical protein PSX37_05505, partial [bacterium]|nr:hypothetical protein [bacterium]
HAQLDAADDAPEEEPEEQPAMVSKTAPIRAAPANVRFAISNLLNLIRLRRLMGLSPHSPIGPCPGY